MYNHFVGSMKKSVSFLVVVFMAIFMSCSGKKNSLLVNDLYINNQTNYYVQVEYCGHYFEKADSIMTRGVSLNPLETKKIFSIYTVNTGRFDRYQDPAYYDSVIIYVNGVEVGSQKYGGLLSAQNFKVMDDKTVIDGDYERHYWEFVIDNEFLNNLQK